jgi:leader peptidase (prepilin peptidase) / N-methyltransferase
MYEFGYLGIAYLFAVSWPLAVIDIRERRLPNRLVLPAIPAALAGQVLASLTGAPWWAMLYALATAAVAFGLGLLANLRGGLGMGDVKLIAAMALSLGWFSPLAPIVGLSLAFVSAGVWLGFKILSKKASMGSSVALGPYLLVGFVLASINQVLS